MSDGCLVQLALYITEQSLHVLLHISVHTDAAEVCEMVCGQLLSRLGIQSKRSEHKLKNCTDMILESYYQPSCGIHTEV